MMRRKWLSESATASAGQWIAVGLLAVLSVRTCGGQTASAAAEEYLLVLGQGADRGLPEWRTAINALAEEIQGNGNVTSSCEGNGSLCFKNTECRSELPLVPHAGSRQGKEVCSLLVYKRSGVHLSAVMSPIGDLNVGTESALGVNQNDGGLLTNASSADESQGSELPPATEKPTAAEVWGFGMLSVAIISLSGLFGALFWPLMKTDFYAQMMWILIGLAVGSLTASATFQLIPEGFKLKEFNEDYLTTAVFMWSSFWALYMFEALSKICLHSKESESSPHDAGQAIHMDAAISCVDHKQHERKEMQVLVPLQEVQNGLKPVKKTMPLYMSHSSIHALTMKKASTHKHSHGQQGLPGKMAPVAWMIIIGDGIHNFIDGMSIGAGFSSSIAVGTSISIAIACEEFPHELGDFAILINSGMSVKRALFYNFLSACTAFAGLALGILLGEIDASIYIFAFAGGLFLYIALTDLMPELNDMIATGLETSKKTALFVLLLQNVGIFLGASILYLVTRLPINIS